MPNPEHAHIDDSDGAEQQGQAEEMQDFDHRKNVSRIADDLC